MGNLCSYKYVIGLGLWLGTLPAFALSPSQPPGSNFDLTHWKCTLPDLTASEIQPSLLENGYTSAYFYTGPDGAMTFWCPVTGGTTANSSYPRSELRELIDPRNSSVNWTGHGAHSLHAQCRVLEQPSTGKVIIGQVHGYQTDPLVKVQWNDGTVSAYFKNTPLGSDTKYALAEIGLGEMIEYNIAVVDGIATVTVNGASASHNFFASGSEWRTNTFYFKAGAYVQDNLGLPDEAGLVAFYELSANHASLQPNAAPRFISQSRNAQGKFVATIACLTNLSYVFETSTNLIHWRPAATNRSSSGVLSYTNPATSSRVFVRARQVS